MCTHNICLYNNVDKKYSGCNLKTMKLLEPAHDKTYDKTCVTSKDSGQPAYLHSLISVFADCMCLLQPSGYSKKNKQESLRNWVDVLADLNLC